jgi:hypothetical protein
MYTLKGQTAGNDEKNMTEASEQQASTGGSAPVYSHKIVPADQPVWGQAELQKRVGEAMARGRDHSGDRHSQRLACSEWRAVAAR